MQSQEISAKTKWVLDPLHSEIGFKVKHLMFTNVKGTFKEYDASIYVTDDDFTTDEIDVWINSASIDTGNNQRDTHLRSAVISFAEFLFAFSSLVINLRFTKYSFLSKSTMIDESYLTEKKAMFSVITLIYFLFLKTR